MLAAMLLVLLAGSASAPVAGSPGPSSTAQGGGDIVEIPVSFDVVNKNDSPLPCPTDGETYTVQGHLVGPRRDLMRGRPDERTVTLLLYGWDSGEWNWRFRDVPGYDYAYEMAKLGHTSVSIDMVGYDTSGHPRGSQICWGAQADISHQIVQQLRDGSYATARHPGAVNFSTVLVSAHDIGPLASIMQAYTWGDIDGLLTQLWAHQGYTPYILSIFGQRVAACLAGGEGAEDPKDEPTRGGEYVFFGPPDDEFRSDLFLEDENATGPGGTDPAVIDAVIRLRNRNPCGQVLTTPPAIRLNLTHMGDINIPVLLVFPGPDDPVISREGQESEAANYRGSNDVTSAWLDSGHFMMLERCAADFRLLTAHWIHERWGAGQPVSPPAVGPDQCVTEMRVKDG